MQVSSHGPFSQHAYARAKFLTSKAKPSFTHGLCLSCPGDHDWPRPSMLWLLLSVLAQELEEKHHAFLCRRLPQQLLCGVNAIQKHIDQTQLARGEFPLGFVPFLGFFEPMYSSLPWRTHLSVIKQPVVYHWAAWFCSSCFLFSPW